MAVTRSTWRCSVLASAVALVVSGGCSSSSGSGNDAGTGTGGRGGGAGTGAGGSGGGGIGGAGGSGGRGGTGVGGAAAGGTGGVGTGGGGASGTGGAGTGGTGGGAGAAGAGGTGGRAGAGGTGGAGGEAAAFTIVTPDVTVQPAAAVSTCYYFHTPNSAALAIRKWTSDMTAGTHHLILYAGAAGQPADGTQSTDACGIGVGSTFPPWLYASHTAHGELALPADDGTGKPLGMAVPAGQPMFIQMYFVNSTTAALAAHVTLSGYAHPAGTAYTQTDALVTYNSMISIPPQATNYTATKTCNVPSGVKFWSVSTESHMQSTATYLKDGSAVVFASTNWEIPGALTWLSTPFLAFTSGAMTYECTYNNTGANQNATVRSGASFQTDEVCMGIGYFFPSTGPKFCFDNTSL